MEEREVGVNAAERFLVIDEMLVGVNDGFDIIELVDDVDVVVFRTSTGFLERFLPLCMCLSQYFESGNASFEHLHFFPSVLLHLPGSGSIFLPIPIWKQFHPTAPTGTTPIISFSSDLKTNA